jgi:predicted RNase H-like nuclease (RuvC/YqgF family)
MLLIAMVMQFCLNSVAKRLTLNGFGYIIHLSTRKTEQKMSKFDTLAAKIKATSVKLESLKAEYAEARLDALRKVEMTKVGETITLTFKSRVLKATKNKRYGRYRVKEGKTTLIDEYMFGIHDLRFLVATGGI